MIGSGSGKVVSSPAGIYCDADCSQEYISGSQVTLTATGFTGSAFVGWSGGGCSGIAPCTVTLNADTQVTANFQKVHVTLSNLPTPYVNHADMLEIRDAFSSDHSLPPMNRIHDGLDFSPMINYAPFQALCEGRIIKIYTFDEQVMVFLACNNNKFVFEYNFETQQPGTGQIQLGLINFVEGDGVSKYDVIGSLCAPNDKAHVHFTMYYNFIPQCAESYFEPSAKTSIESLVQVVFHSYNRMCFGSQPQFPPMPTPYLLESDMLTIRKAYSSAYSTSPWGGENLGFDIYPQGDLKPFQATCDGKVDTVALDQSPAGYWRVNVFVHCNDYVYDPDDGGYFIPFFTKYTFETMSLRHIDGQDQLSKIRVAEGDYVGAGDIIGELKWLIAKVMWSLEPFSLVDRYFLLLRKFPSARKITSVVRRKLP